MGQYVVRNGLDIPILGRPTGEIVKLDLPDTASVDPTELKGLKPRPVVREGDEVRVGAVLLHDKTHPAMVLRSPVAGRVREIRRAERRVITDVVIEVTGDEAEELPTLDRERIAALGREEAAQVALATGLWPALRTRPLNNVPDPTRSPQSIWIGAMETGPLQPDGGELIGSGDGPALQLAVDLFRRLAPKVHLATRAGSAHPALDRLEGVERHTFAGPHPAGDLAVQVNLGDPPRGGAQVWTIRAWDAALLGRALLEGRYPGDRVYAAVGAGVTQPRLTRTVQGAPLRHVVGATTSGPLRWIRGSVLTGERVDAGRWAGFTARAVHVLPDEVPRDLFGWALPMFGAWSSHPAFLKGLLRQRPSHGVDLRPGVYGGHRAIVPIGVYDGVIATPDILPEFLFKAILAGDLEESVQLGMLDLSDEEAALCTYVCPSKMAYDVLLREGLATYERETG